MVPLLKGKPLWVKVSWGSTLYCLLRPGLENQLDEMWVVRLLLCL